MSDSTTPPPPPQPPQGAPVPPVPAVPPVPQAQSSIPPKKKSRLGWIIGGIVGVVVLAFVGLFVLGALLVRGSDGPVAEPAASPDVPPGAASAPDATVPSDAEVTLSDDGQVETACYTFSVPEGYVLEPASAGCLVGVNIPGGDGLSRIEIHPNANTGSAAEALEKVRSTLTSGQSVEVQSVELTTLSSGRPAIKAVYIQNTLDQNMYIIPTEERYRIGDGEADGFMIVGMAYNSTLADAVSTVVNSFEPATPAP